MFKFQKFSLALVAFIATGTTLLHGYNIKVFNDAGMNGFVTITNTLPGCKNRTMQPIEAGKTYEYNYSGWCAGSCFGSITVYDSNKKRIKTASFAFQTNVGDYVPSTPAYSLGYSAGAAALGIVAGSIASVASGCRNQNVVIGKNKKGEIDIFFK